MSPSILYLGDTCLTQAADYLAGLMSRWQWSFDYVPSDQAADVRLFAERRSLFVVSDYPAARLSHDLQRRVLEQVAAGAGLVMIGGWESFHGLGGNWDGTPLGDALPVVIAANDDRVNCDQPLLVRRLLDHPTVAGLPWEQRPPVIGGFNRVVPKPEATVVLEAQRFDARRDGNTFSFIPNDAHPLLVIGAYGSGRTAAFTTDVAPHWVGPLVDWGLPRVSAQALGGNAIEVGGDYARFLQQMLTWLGRL